MKILIMNYRIMSSHLFLRKSSIKNIISIMIFLKLHIPTYIGLSMYNLYELQKNPFSKVSQSVKIIWKSTHSLKQREKKSCVNCHLRDWCWNNWIWHGLGVKLGAKKCLLKSQRTSATEKIFKLPTETTCAHGTH